MEHRYQAYHQLHSIEELSDLALSASELVYQLEKETAASSFQISSPNEQNLEALVAQRKASNEAMANYNALLENIDPLLYGHEFEGQVGWAQGRLSELESLRNGVDKMYRKDKAKRRRIRSMMKDYAIVSDVIFDVVAAVFRQSTNAEVTTLGAAYVSLLQSKERTTQIRTLLINAFSNNKFESGLYKKYIELSNEERSYHRMFFSFAKESHLEMLQKAVFGAYSEQVEAFKFAAMDQGLTGGFDQSATEWHNAISGHIGLLRNVENTLAKEIRETTASSIYNLKMEMIRYAGFVSFAALVSIIFSIWTIHQTSSQIRDLHYTMNRVYVQADLTKRVAVKSDDQIGSIATSLNLMLDKLRSIVSEIRNTSMDLALHSSHTRRISSEISQNTAEGYAQAQMIKMALNKPPEDEAAKSLAKDAASHVDELYRTTTMNSIELEGHSDSLQKMSEQMEKLVTGFKI